MPPAVVDIDDTLPLLLPPPPSISMDVDYQLPALNYTARYWH